MAIFKYQRIVTPGPNGTALYFANNDTNDGRELADVDGWRYVHFPDTATVPQQHTEIQWQAVTLDPALKDQIKAASRPVKLIADAMQQRIRDVYSVEDEAFFARIGVGVALGAYAFQTGEQEALLAFGAYVESVRQWGRDERAKLGL